MVLQLWSTRLGGVRTLRTWKVRVADLTITTASPLPNGRVGEDYADALAKIGGKLSATGGKPPYTWSLVGGSLPLGLTLNQDGTITGTPSSPGDSTFTTQ